MLQRIQLRDDEEGVSEVVGSILTLVITVSLFSSIFIGVQSLQPPEGGNHIDFSATFEKNKINEYYINITNEGDGTLSSECSINIVDEDGVSHPYSFSDDSSGNDFNDGEWNLGDTLNLKFSGSEKDIFEDSKSVELVIIDDRKSRVVWRDTIKTGDILAPIIQDYGVDYPLEWESYTLPGEKVTLWTDVIDKDTTGPLNVSVDLHKLEGQYNNNNLELTGRYKQKETTRYKLNLKIHDEQDNGTYLLKLNASDNNGNQNTESYYFVLHIGRFAEAEDGNLIVDPNNFISTPDTPQNGQGYSLTATVYNDGGRKAVADIEFWDQHPDGKSYLIDTVEDVSFPVGGGRNIQSDWIVNDSGTHKITVDATNPSNGRAGKGSINITVSPTILVVDDASTNGPRSERKTMVNALEASDFEYELYEVNGGDGPAYNTGPNPLEEYDIVIWLTGSKTSNTLTQNDEDNLELFLEDNRKLWLIGDGIEEQSTAASWVSSNLNVDFKQSNEVPQSPLIGNEIPFKSDKKFHIDESLADKSDRISSLYNANESLIDSSKNEYCYMVSNKSDKPGGVRTVFQSFLFSSLNEKITGSRTRLAYKAIMWLGNMSKRSGIDLAISSQETSDLAPKYMDNLNISATIRNNGQENITTEAVLEVDGSIIKTNQSIVVGAEDTTGISFNWLADELGEHELKIIVDPFDKIDETNEINNDVSYQGDVPVINVEFTTLIVDDDGKDGGEGSDNSTYYVENAYKSLGYTYEMFYANSSDTDSEVPGPDVDKMSYYNAICWVAGSGNDPFYEEKGINVDIENITAYLGQYESNFIIIGDRALQNIPEGFRSDKLRVKQNSVDDKDSPPHLLNGIKNDPITHGFEYRLKESISDKPYHYNLLDEADPILNSSQDNTEYTYSHRYQNETSNYKITYLGVDPIHFKQAYSEDESEWYEELDYDLTGKSMREELFFKINQWFGKYDDRIELRASDIDVKVSSKHPTLVMGSSFVIRAKIQNMGGTGADALIRFKDGYTHIATESMYVPAHSLKTVEVKWKPVNAGEDRPIRVIVDPLRELGEIPNNPGENNKEDHLGFNNQAITYSDVFYFWDDMENGTKNWNHESNLALINGEVPINYMGGQYDSLDTDIIGNWAPNTEGVNKVNSHSHSNPYSYNFNESKGEDQNYIKKNGVRYFHKYSQTPSFNIENMESMKLSFWQKYNIFENESGGNGGFIQVGIPDGNDWKWRYEKPLFGPYTGKLNQSLDLKDSKNNPIQYCWNGRSGGGTLDWEFVKLNLDEYADNESISKIRIKFNFTVVNETKGMGWLIDDVSITGKRKGNNYYPVSDKQKDVWHYVDDNGNMAWWNGINYTSPKDQHFRGGIDNRLISKAIDLTNAKTAKLSADFKFNINNSSGRPPDGFRVEITTDNGITWESINLGSRAASGYSGNNTRYPNNKNGWVRAENNNNKSLNRLLLDLSDFSGETIQLRFRVVTNNVQQHFATDPETAGYGGLYIDNVVISGHTI